MQKVEVPEEQKIYAGILYYGSIIGIILLTVTFILYITGIAPPYIPYEKLTELWTKSTHHLIEETNIPTGWAWISLVHYGEFLNLLVLAVLALLTIGCYLAIIPVFVRKKDWIYTILAVIEIFVLLLAASGILQVGH